MFRSIIDKSNEMFTRLLGSTITLSKEVINSIITFDYRIYRIQIYVTWSFLKVFFVVSIVLTFLGTIFTFLMDIMWFINSGMLQKKFQSIMIVYFFRAPNIFYYLAPLCVLISISYVFSKMSKNFELVAIVTSGMSIKQLFYPLIVTGLILSILFFFFNDNIMTASAKKARYIERVVVFEETNFASPNKMENILIPIKSKNPEITYRQIGMVSIDGKMSNVSINKFFISDKESRLNYDDKSFEAGLIEYTINAKYAQWVPSISNWELYDVEIIKLNRNSEVVFKKTEKKFIPDFQIDPPDHFFPLPYEFSALSLSEMKSELLKGISSFVTFGKEDYQQKLMLIYTRVSSACTIIISLLIALGFINIMSKKYLFTTMAVKSVIVYVIYYVCFLAGMFLGQNKILPEVLGAWIGNIVFLIYGIYNISRVKT